MLPGARVSPRTASKRRPFAVLTVIAAAASLASLTATAPSARGTGPVASGVIRGRVDLRQVAAAAEARPSVAELGMPRPRDLADRLKSVVYLETAPRGAFERIEPRRAVMNQRNETFVPHLLAITTGTVVDFPNGDPFYHNVFSLSKANRFDLGRYPTGKLKSVQFTRPGIVRVFCEIHSHMNAFILVFSHPFFAVTDDEGRYRIDDVPPGAYNVIAWNEGRASAPRPVTVPDGGTTELDFTLR
jgi:plastocyanin